ncbi:putative uncharacterized protein DDB_G0290521 [Ptychodera flava]|uniref:putative uncharacterized protein DDB_G0290521 n=1 Tax=Ptychodera flava TaxID=63121 RepID=UPI00396A4A88
MRTAVKACYQHCNQLEKLGDEFDQEPVTIDVNDIPQAIQHLTDQYGDSMEVMDILTSTPASVQPSVISPEASDPGFLTSPIPQYQDNTTLDTNTSIAVFTAQSSAASPAQQPTVIPMPIQPPAQQPTLILMSIQPPAQQPTLTPVPTQLPAEAPSQQRSPAQQPTLTLAPIQPQAEQISKRPRESINNIRKSKRARRRPAKLVE